MVNYAGTSALHKQFDLSFDINMVLEAQFFPFSCVLSLEPLIALWQQCGTSERPGRAALAQRVQEELAHAPELRGPISDLSVITRHKEIVDLLMTLVFPIASWERDYGAAYLPYQFRSFYATPAFANMLMAADGSFGDRMQVSEQTLNGVRTLGAYVNILRKFYGINLDFDFPLVLTTTDPVSGLERHFKMRFSRRFLDIQQHGAPKALSPAEQKHLLSQPTNLQIWMELLPPEHFIFQGFAVAHAVDVTDQEVLSSLKRDVVEKVSLVSETKFLDLQEKLRTLLQRPDIVLGLVALQGQQALALNPWRTSEQSCLFTDSVHYALDDLASSVHTQALQQGVLCVVEDLAALPSRSPLEEEFYQRGMRNLVVVPLYYQDEMLGILELASPTPGDFHALSTLKLRDVLPIFSMAVKRSLEELNTRVQAFIKEQYTAIHPAIEWRFRQAALQVMRQQRQGLIPEMQPIVLEDIFPLYAVSDIRGSSTQRNEAIQADLIEHLNMARSIIVQAHTLRPLPALDEITFRIDKHITQIEASLNAGDEESVLDFLRRDVEPVFEHLAEFDSSLHQRIHEYRAEINPHLGMLSHRRRAFEESVTRLNDTISAYLDSEEIAAQKMFPHYFEKHSTDGVEHGIYIGPALMEDGKFDPLYLHNLRLWQLLVMCGSALLTARLRDRLKVPLEMTHLVLAHHTPLSIRFHPDEKQFEVDGAYNMRYEIIKKRIDKALIKDSAERLTQPGKIAIVYSQPREAAEYRQYIDYLREKGYINYEVEDVELEDLQGAHGLKALRVTVNMQADVPRHGAPPTPAEHVEAAPDTALTLPREDTRDYQSIVLPS
ncbi:MAG: GAF domain-containing protein [Candidatus Tectimicrobiota bacterium]